MKIQFLVIWRYQKTKLRVWRVLINLGENMFMIIIIINLMTFANDLIALNLIVSYVKGKKRVAMSSDDMAVSPLHFGSSCNR